MSENGGTEEDVARRIKKANGAFAQLYPVWRNLNIPKEIKIRIFNVNVKSVLLYVCETWKTTNQITRRQQILLNKCLRWIMNINGPIRLQTKKYGESPIRSQQKIRLKEANVIGLDTHYIKKQKQQRKLHQIGILRDTEGEAGRRERGEGQ